MTQQALKDRRWQSACPGSIIETIKGKPYCLKLGNLKPDPDNFLGFFQNFYSYMYQDQMTKPLIKPSEVFNPLIPKPIVTQRSSRSSQSSRRKTMTLSRQLEPRYAPPQFHSIDLNAKREQVSRSCMTNRLKVPSQDETGSNIIKNTPRKTSRNAINRQKTHSHQKTSGSNNPPPKRLLQHKSAYDCTRLIQNCDQFLSDKFKSSLKKHPLSPRKHSISS